MLRAEPPTPLAADTPSAAFEAAFQVAAQHFNAGRHDQALDTAAALHEAGRGQPRQQARAALVGAKTAWNAKRAAEGIRWADQALDAASLAAASDLLAEAWALKGSCHALDGAAALAVQCLDHAVRELSPKLSPSVQRTVLTAVGLSYQYLGLFEPALPPLRRAYHLAAQGGSVEHTLQCAVNLAYALVEAVELTADGPAGPREQALAEARALAEVISTRLPQPTPDFLFHATHDALGRLLLSCGDLPQAIARLQACVDRGVERRPFHLASWWIDIAYAHQLAGDVAAARAAAAEARRWLAADTQGARSAIEFRRMARLSVVEGDAMQALAWMRRFHAQVVSSGHAMLEARAAELTLRETTQSLQLEVAELREQRADLHAQFRELEQMARTDGLTGLLNRSAIEEEFDQLRAHPRHVALFDLDHFKAINDRYGHAVGDAVLRVVGRLMTETFRGLDRPARYGGEELAALLVNTGGAGAVQAADRLRQRVAEHDWSAVHAGLVVTLSAGVAPVAPGEAFADAVARADAALYAAKAAGRNRVVEAAPR